jgi:hypothetical protein
MIRDSECDYSDNASGRLISSTRKYGVRMYIREPRRAGQDRTPTPNRRKNPRGLLGVGRSDSLTRHKCPPDELAIWGRQTIRTVMPAPTMVFLPLCAICIFFRRNVEISSRLCCRRVLDSGVRCGPVVIAYLPMVRG